MTGSFKRNASRNNERGYVLLSLLLMVALMIIAAAAIVPSITFEIKRDREEEMIHRGVQYSRAIRAYYKKFGRYPTKLEDLESSNNMRFLRKRYKDPITGKDFKLLHFGDVKLTFTGGVVGAGINGATALNNAAALNNPNALGGQPVLGAVNGSNPASTFGNQATSLGANTNTTAGDNSATGTEQTQNAGDGTPQPAGQPQPLTNSSSQPAGTTFGGSAVVGVVSTSKKETIREFNHKRKYNEWQFIYDPATDRGGLLMTPNQPPLQGGQGFGLGNGMTPNMNGQYNGNGPTGMQNNLNSPSSNNGTNSDSPNNPPQQQ